LPLSAQCHDHLLLLLLLLLLLQVLNRGAARCWSSETYNPVPGVLEDPMLPSNRGYKAGEVLGQQLEC
jgi:hypothetical protein